MESKTKNKKNQRNKKIVALFLIIVFIIIGVLAIFHKSQLLTNKKTSLKVPPPLLPTKPLKTQSSAKTFFATNGQTTVYKINKNNKWAVIFNGKKGKYYDYVSNPVFSADGNQLAYNAEINGQALVVINNIQEINAYQKADNIVFSPNGQQIAFVAAKDNNTFIIISGPAPGSPATSSSTIPTSVTSPVYQESTVTVSGDVTNVSVSDSGQATYQVQSENETATVVDNQIVSTAPVNSSTNTTNTTTTSSSNSTSSDSVNNSTSNSSDPNAYHYPYAISTHKDIDLSKDPNRLNHSACDKSSDKQCNF